MVLYSQCSNPHVDRCSNPLPWDPRSSPQKYTSRHMELCYMRQSVSSVTWSYTAYCKFASCQIVPSRIGSHQILHMYVYIYIYIYIERERGRYMYMLCMSGTAQDSAGQHSTAPHGTEPVMSPIVPYVWRVRVVLCSTATCLSLSLYIYIYTHTHIYTHDMHTYIHTCLYIRVYIYIYIHMYTYIYRERERTHILCMYVYIYIYIHTHTRINVHSITSELSGEPLPAAWGFPLRPAASHIRWPSHEGVLIDVYVYIYIYIYIYIYTHVCIYIYIYIYTHHY